MADGYEAGAAGLGDQAGGGGAIAPVNNGRMMVGEVAICELGLDRDDATRAGATAVGAAANGDDSRRHVRFRGPDGDDGAIRASEALVIGHRESDGILAVSIRDKLEILPA